MITANEVKRNRVRATERGTEAWSTGGEPMNKNRIVGAGEQGEVAHIRREASSIGGDPIKIMRWANGHETVTRSW